MEPGLLYFLCSRSPETETDIRGLMQSKKKIKNPDTQLYVSLLMHSVSVQHVFCVFGEMSEEFYDQTKQLFVSALSKWHELVNCGGRGWVGR